MNEVLKNIRACADNKWQAFINVRGLLFVGPKFTDRDLAALDADKAKFWMKGRGILRNEVTPNFPEMWKTWELDPENKAPNISPELETFLARFPAEPVARTVVTSSRRLVAPVKLLSSRCTLLALLDESPSRLNDEERVTLREAGRVLHKLLA